MHAKQQQLLLLQLLSSRSSNSHMGIRDYLQESRAYKLGLVMAT